MLRNADEKRNEGIDWLRKADAERYFYGRIFASTLPKIGQE